MAYLFKHTPLQTSFIVNLTCLDADRSQPRSRAPGAAGSARRCSGTSCTSGSTSSPGGSSTSSSALKKRVHILEGFEKVFDALDEILKIVRKSEGKAGRRAADHQALRARRRSDRRHPRAEDLPARAARDPDHPQGARGQAPAHPADQHAAQGRAEPLGHRPRRDRGDSEEVRRRAAHDHLERRRGVGVHRRGLHRRRGQRRASSRATAG